MRQLLYLLTVIIPLAASGVVLHTGTAAAETLSRNEVFELQFRLNQLSHDAGRPDGVAGTQTRRAAASFARANGLPAGISEALLGAARTATADIEGLARPGGNIDFLVRTDQGTPLILTVEAVGRIYKDDTRRVIRDRDVDGRPIYSLRGDWHIEPTLQLPSQAGILFGYRLRVPTPPVGERLQIDHVVAGRELNDGATRHVSDRHEHIYRRAPNNPRYWYHSVGKDPADRPLGTWTFRLQNDGRTLISRNFEFSASAGRVAQRPQQPQQPVTWTATSSTAIAITGDLTVQGDKLTFGNGAALPLIFVAEKKGRWAPFKAGKGKIFRLDPPVDPVLLNGNKLCGMPMPVTYIVLSEHAPNSLSLTAFTGSSSPSRFGDHSCAAYFYERAAAAQKVERHPVWWTHVTNDPATAGFETTATDGTTILDGGCNTKLGPGFHGSLYNYAGDALRRVDDVSEPIVFEIRDGQGGRTSFAGAMHYFAPDRAWVITDKLPVIFLDALAAGGTLTIRNGKGDAAVEFDLTGAAKAVGVMRAVCG